MSKIPVQNTTTADKASLPVFAEIRKRFDEVRTRAQDLFRLRGEAPGRELEDWLQAEREVFGEAKAELAETADGYEIQVALPGFEPKDVQVTATPEEIVVRAASEQRKQEADKQDRANVLWSEFGSREVYRYFGLSRPVITGKVTAKIGNGMLQLTVPCAASAKPVTSEVRQVKIVAA